MPFNWSGTLAALHALVRPRLVIPNLIINDIRALNFSALREAGYKGVVLDKDNCLTLPHRDVLIHDLDTAWEDLKHEFGGNLLIVSNSAGTQHDAGGLAAESVAHHLGAPVLRHSSLKPSRRSITAIQRYFTSLSSPISDCHLVVIGDRVLTDIVLANRIGACGVLVTRNWEASVKSFMIGFVERMVVRLARRCTGDVPSPSKMSKFVKETGERKDEVKMGPAGSTWTWTGRALGLGSNTGRKL